MNGWQNANGSATLPPGTQTLNTISANFPIGQYGGLYYRVRMGVRWNVGSTVLGTASYAFDYSSLNAFGGAWAGQIGAMSEAVCWIP